METPYGIGGCHGSVTPGESGHVDAVNLCLAEVLVSTNCTGFGHAEHGKLGGKNVLRVNLFRLEQREVEMLQKQLEGRGVRVIVPDDPNDIPGGHMMILEVDIKPIP
jgi:hypothetical protein